METDVNGVPIAWPDVIWPNVYTFQGKIYSTGIATWFGGDDDPEDDGTTASGINTKGNPNIIGCALPIPTCSATHGSPLPIMRYIHTTVEVGVPNTLQILPSITLIDVGPAVDTGHMIDLTQAAFIALGGDLTVGTLKVAICISPVYTISMRLRHWLSRS